MTRNRFILTFILITTIWAIWEYSAYSRYAGGGFFLLVSYSALVIARRKYLKMKPTWGGEFSDLPTYIRKP